MGALSNGSFFVAGSGPGMISGQVITRAALLYNPKPGSILLNKKTLNMKTIAFLFIVALAACRSTNGNTTEQTFTIPSYTSAQRDLAHDTATHKAGDMEVFMITGKDTVYIARIYRKDGGEVRHYETMINGSTFYDKASYQWLNDSTAAFKLTDSKNNRDYNFQLSGSGATTTVQ
jgi:hypothetical protein